MDIEENFLSKIIRTLMDKGIIQVVRNSMNYTMTAGMRGAVGCAMSILWDLLQGLGGQLYNRLRQRNSNNSIFSIIREEILNFVRGYDYMSLIKTLVQKALQFLEGLMGRAISLNPYATKSIDKYHY